MCRPRRRSFVSVALDPQVQLYFGDEKLVPAALATRIAQAALENPRAEVQLRADKAVPYGRVAELIAMVQKAGLNRIGFVTEPGAGSKSDWSMVTRKRLGTKFMARITTCDDGIPGCGLHNVPKRF